MTALVSSRIVPETGRLSDPSCNRNRAYTVFVPSPGLRVQVAEPVAEGYLSARLLPTTRDEIGLLPNTFNRMAEQMQERVTALSTEKDRLAAILEHMADGVVITDEDGLVNLINPSATRLLNTTEEDAVGRSLAEVVRHHRLIELSRRCRTQGEEQTETVEMDRQGPFLQVVMTPLRADDSQVEGV